jgi:hypothetical protein
MVVKCLTTLKNLTLPARKEFGQRSTFALPFHGGGPDINQPPNLLEAVRAWRETGTAPYALTGKHVESGRIAPTTPR